MKYVTMYELNQSFEDVLIDNGFYIIFFFVAIIILIRWIIKTKRLKEQENEYNKQNPQNYFDRSIYDKERWIDRNRLVVIPFLFLVFTSTFFLITGIIPLCII